MDGRDFRSAMGKFATGVTVVTTKLDNGEVHGMTANAFMSVSLQPMLITVSIDEKALMLEKIHQSGKFAISILSDKQVDVSKFFAGQSIEEEIEEFEWFDQMPVIKESILNIICDVHSFHKIGDHTLFFGEVTNINNKEGDPLLFYSGKYFEAPQAK